MNARIKYGILFGILGIILGVMTGLFLSVMLYGIFWLFIFGDDKWPSYAYPLIYVIITIVFLVIACVFVYLGVKYGSKKDPNKKYRKIKLVLL